MSDIVYAQSTCSAATADGIPVRMVEGEPWAAEDPFVKTHPGLFAATPPGPGFPRRTEHPVEQATAAPGERRSVKRA